VIFYGLEIVFATSRLLNLGLCQLVERQKPIGLWVFGLFWLHLRLSDASKRRGGQSPNGCKSQKKRWRFTAYGWLLLANSVDNDTIQH
jgi:hypothetical protein